MSVLLLGPNLGSLNCPKNDCAVWENKNWKRKRRTHLEVEGYPGAVVEWWAGEELSIETITWLYQQEGGSSLSPPKTIDSRCIQHLFYYQFSLPHLMHFSLKVGRMYFGVEWLTRMRCSEKSIERSGWPATVTEYPRDQFKHLIKRNPMMRYLRLVSGKVTTSVTGNGWRSYSSKHFLESGDEGTSPTIANTAEIVRFSTVRSPPIPVSCYCTKWQFQGWFP